MTTAGYPQGRGELGVAWPHAKGVRLGHDGAGRGAARGGVRARTRRDVVGLDSIRGAAMSTEACTLPRGWPAALSLLTAATESVGGEIFIRKMPVVRIPDLAEALKRRPVNITFKKKAA